MAQEQADKEAATDFPAWHYGPKGEAEIFHAKKDVPAGWHDHPSKHKTPAKEIDAEKAKLNAGTAAKPGAGVGTTTETGAGGNSAIAPGDFDAIDVDGHKWNPELHAKTRTKTNDGRWRMAVGKSRPAPLPGFPKPDQMERAKANQATENPSSTRPGGVTEGAALDL